jgi:N-acetylated-alpha-linked acidic dipeptidase
MAQTAATAVMRMADAELLPFNFADLANTVHGYTRDIEKLAEAQRNQIADRNRQIAEGVFRAGAEAGGSSVTAQAEPEPPRLDFSPLDNAVEALGRSADHYQRIFDQAEANGAAALARSAAAQALDRVNKQLLAAERTLTDPKGLPGRPWYKHQLYAPGFYTGYGVKTIPAVREAIEQKQWDLAAQSILSVTGILTNAAAAVERAATDLEHAVQ